jgi:P-type Ca2+ transporter type 2C
VTIPWHAVPPSEALDRLGSGPGGLDETEAAARLARHGPNVFRVAPPVSAWLVLAAQLRSMIVLLLATAAAIALLTGDALDAGAIAAVLVLNVAIGFVTELRAHRAMESLLDLEVTRAQVLRRGRVLAIDAPELVPGDVIDLEAGQMVPADARLLVAAELRTAEASLTGEPVPADKDADAPVTADVPLPDRITMVYKATMVTGGRGRGVVVATGMDTEIGRIGVLARGIPPEPTPLERRLGQLGRRLAAVALVVAALVAGLEALHGVPLAGIVQTALALAVAAVPEGLPVVGTIAMAVGMHRMARRRALVRRLPVVETLGSATVICTDKTGTLTAGEMTVTVIRLLDREIALTGAGYAPEGGFLANGRPVDPRRDAALQLTLRIGALANRSDVTLREGAWRVRGDPTEAALVVAARKAGLEPARLRQEWPEAGELPFSSERMLMATYHRTPTLVACVKGAPKRVLELSLRVLAPEGPRALAEGEREELLRLNRELAERGLRVLALAMKDVDAIGDANLHGLTWLGFVGISDPPAPGVPDTIRAFRDAGIRTVMLTGDQKPTAESVARQLGLLEARHEALDGRELDGLSDDQLQEAVARTAAFSRVSPEAKLRIVRAFQQRGEIVAMLGDGVNDAAALRKADIGVVMGLRGTDLAKEAAQLVLLDDRFATIAAAIEEGRVIFDNIRKFVFYLFSCNLAEIMVLLGVGVVGLPVPLLPLQILWLNLLTDTFPALALAVEPAEAGTMRQPPRDPRAAILSTRMLWATVGYAVLIAGVSVAAFVWGLSGPSGANGRARSLTFMTLALAQVFHLGNARSDLPVTALGRALRNRFAVGAVVFTVGLQLLAASLPPLARLLRIEPLAVQDWAVITALSLIPAVVGQTLKWARARV